MITLEAILFNHDKRSAKRRAINIRRNVTHLVGEPEWQRLTSTNPEDSPVAYALRQIQNQSVTIRASFSSPETKNFSAEIRVKKHIPPQQVTFVRGKTGFVSIELTELVRAFRSIGIWDAEWHWEYRLAPRSRWNEFAISRHRIYFLLDLPTAPWRQSPSEAANTQLPWTDILDYACRWAEGASSPREVAAAITRKVYALGSNLIKYDCPGGGSSHYSMFDFDATAFLDRLKGGFGNGLYVNCSDCATIVSTFANAVGANLWQSRMGWNFALNEILAIGASKWQTPCGWSSFNYHEVAWTNSCIGRDDVFDACLELDGDEDPTTLPHAPLLPQGLRFSRRGVLDYRKRLVKPADRLSCNPQPTTRRRRLVL
jgi:hypothetical protein